MTRPRTMLGLAAALALCIGCMESADEAAGLGDPDNGGGGAAPAECVVNDDCAPAASSCCECPTFALSIDSRYDDSCEDVNCDAPSGDSCPDTRAVCTSAGSCVLECRPLAVSECAQSCEMGYVADAFGCLTCECTQGASPGLADCTVDEDCAQVASDCCGCARGGVDTAVPASQVTDFFGELGCDGSAVCPEVDVCDPDKTPQCIAGSCQLAPATDTPPDTDPGTTPGDDVRCGTAMYPECPAGQVCVLNDPQAKDATAAGVGVCRGE